ncbi:phospholipase [Verticillium dahliae VdLs.17]|uniref:Phospholipase n=1 Tax=Verticillium dahliae (strain VdLs.17 / ATCC MYA-4575 / FGSC 10137) TaxID=498257 RepID=G2XFT2_VERDV|nr:phospholipase [Verticillium dahliae VdLs.17]EGY18680.1 phospholipase [Verticillium dahliae VdLs.17]
MKPRSPTMWLGLSGCENNYDLIVSNRLRLVTSHLPRPDTQRPSLVVLVGGRAKSIALHAMFGVRIAQPATGSPGSNEIHLHLAPQTSFHERPVLLAEGHLYNSHARVVPTTCPQDARRQAIIWTAQSGMERRVTGELYCRLLAPFADVFCFFCDDLDGGLEGVARHLATWLDHGPQAQNPANAHPKIVVVSSTVLHGVQGEAKAKTDLLAMLEKETRRETSNLSAYISFVTVLPHTSVSATARYRALKERIMRISDDVRQSRVDARCLFSATHVAALLDGACDHFASASDLPFDLVQESRRRNPVPENLESHVTEFVGRGTPQTELVTFAMPVIGSSLFLDAYPPGAHLFDPVDVFEGLYSDMLNRAFSNESMPLGRDGSTCMPSDGLIQLVKAHFVGCFSELARHSGSASDIHLRLLRRFKSHWLRIHSTRLCLSCLSHVPQYGLSCGHVHCEACVWDYGRPSDEDPWVTLYGQCHLCDTLLSEEAVIRRHPPTAGVGVFCLDGGGVRGIVSLEILKRIHEAIKLPIPLTRFIKIFFGISSGECFRQTRRYLTNTV